MPIPQRLQGRRMHCRMALGACSVCRAVVGPWARLCGVSDGVLALGGRIADGEGYARRLQTALILPPCFTSMLAYCRNAAPLVLRRTVQSSGLKAPDPTIRHHPLIPRRAHWASGVNLYRLWGALCPSREQSTQGEERQERSRPGVSAALDATSALRPLCRVPLVMSLMSAVLYYSI